jgi:4-amino-4-deoxy-L-arabinose transferase-like glycosyltransferase
MDKDKRWPQLYFALIEDRSFLTSKNSGSQFNRSIVVCLLLAVALFTRLWLWSLVVQTDPSRFLRPDSASYLDSAAALAEIGRFAAAPDQPANPQHFRTPGYPLYLAALYRLAGGNDVRLVALSQVALSLLTLALVYWLGRRLWNRTTGALAVALLVLDLPSLTYTLFVMSETLFTLLLLLGAIALMMLVEPATGARIRWALAGGILLGLATLVRPVSYYLALPLGVGVSWLGWRGGWGRALVVRCLLALLASYALLVGAWQVRNFVQTGDPAISSVMANNLYFYRAAGVIALRDGVSLESAQTQLRSGLPALQGVALNRWMSEQGMILVRTHPGLALRSQINGALTMMAGLGDGWLTALLTGTPGVASAAWELLSTPSWEHWRDWALERPMSFAAFWLSAAQLFVVYTGVALWWFNRWRARRLAGVDLLFWLVIVYFILLSAGPEANSRFRAPIMPFLALYAAAGWVQAYAHLDGLDQLRFSARHSR